MSIPYRRTAPVQIWRRCITRSVFLGLICALVAACGLLQEDHITPLAQPASIAAERGGEPAVASALAHARPRRKPQPLTMPAPQAAPTPPAPSLAGPDLVGNDEFVVLASLGEPAARIRQGSGQLWHYDRTQCALDLLFFFDLASDRYRLALVHRNGASVDPAELAGCIDSAPPGEALS
jgi:hypothetical protein